MTRNLRPGVLLTMLFSPAIMAFAQETPEFVIARHEDHAVLSKVSEGFKSPTNAYYAFVQPFTDPEYHDQRDSLFVLNRSNNTITRVRNQSLSHRPIENLKWVGPHRLRFDIWAGPHFGGRYVYNAKANTIVRVKDLRG